MRYATRSTSLPALLLMALCHLLALPALGEERLAPAWSAFQQGKLDQAARQVRDLLPGLGSAEELRDAHLLLGACAFVQGDVGAAEKQMIEALSHDPGYAPDPLLLSPDLQSFVSRVARERRAEIQKRAAAHKASASQPASAPVSPLDQKPLPDQKPERTRALEEQRAPAAATPIYLAVLPFGVGQLANGHRTKGWMLLGAEGLLGAASIVCLATALGLRDSRGKYPPERIDAARALNAVYLATGYTALALMVYGLVDGLYYRSPNRRAPRRSTWLTPGAPGSAGLGLAHRF